MSNDGIQVAESVSSYIADGPQELPPGYKRTEMGVIPQDWQVDTLTSVTPPRAQHAIVDGPFGSNLKRIHYRHSGVPIITSGYVTEGHFRADEYLYVDEEKFKQEKRSAVRGGEIVMAKIGARCGASAILPGDHSIGILSGNALKIRVDESRHSTFFIWQLLWSRYTSGDIEAWKSVGAQPAISLPVLKKQVFQLPPLAEQRAIAEALADAAGLLGSLDALIAKKRAIKEAAMQQLLAGKARLPGFSGEWRWNRIDDVATVDPENLSSATNPNFSFNYISLEQVDAGRLLGVTQEIFRTAPSRARRVVRHDDLLMSTVRPNLMAHLHFKSQVPRAVCSTGFAVLRARPDKADPGFLFPHLFGYVVNNRIEKILAGSNYPAINNRDVRAIEVPCPPTVSEQTAIALILSDMDVEIAALEARRDKTRAIKQGMMQQLLTGRVRLVKPEAAA